MRRERARLVLVTLRMDDDVLTVNCGRCGRPFRITISEIGDKRTLECGACERLSGRGPELGSGLVVADRSIPSPSSER